MAVFAERDTLSYACYGTFNKGTGRDNLNRQQLALKYYAVKGYF